MFMPTRELIPAAEYIRMSTEDQKYSTPFQKETNRRYAAENGFSVCRTYLDAGKSGTVIKHRDALNQLLQDVLSGKAPYKAILVYDVSRWGRFPNPDEAAHYEFICGKAGVPVHYCAEQFRNDGSLQSSLLKALKRTMAGEFSRELGVRVFDALKQVALQGFHTGNIAPYGFERMLVSPTGRWKGILHCGERKNLKTDKVLLVPGKKSEVEMVRRIFHMCANEKQNCPQIAAQLNAKGFTFRGKDWNCDRVLQIVRRAQYAGLNVWGRRKVSHQGPSCLRPKSQWITGRAPCAAIVDETTFLRAQQVLASNHTSYTSEGLLDNLKRILRRHKSLSAGLIDRSARGRVNVYAARFGSLLKAYELIGYKASPQSYAMSYHSRQRNAFYNHVLSEVQRLFPGEVRLLPVSNQRRLVEVDRCTQVSLFICGRRARSFKSGKPQWLLRLHPGDKENVALICKLDSNWTTISDYYVLPPMRDSIRHSSRLFSETDCWLTSTGERLNGLDDFVQAVRRQSVCSP
jgi:DNA invertase Pin-like site-specific DNA recombinase